MCASLSGSGYTVSMITSMIDHHDDAVAPRLPVTVAVAALLRRTRRLRYSTTTASSARTTRRPVLLVVVLPVVSFTRLGTYY